MIKIAATVHARVSPPYLRQKEHARITADAGMHTRMHIQCFHNRDSSSVQEMQVSELAQEMRSDCIDCWLTYFNVEIAEYMCVYALDSLPPCGGALTPILKEANCTLGLYQVPKLTHHLSILH